MSRYWNEYSISELSLGMPFVFAACQKIKLRTPGPGLEHLACIIYSDPRTHCLVFRIAYALLR